MENVVDNQFHNILRLFDVLANFVFTTSETVGHYYLETQFVRVASRVAERLKTQDLRKLGNIRKLSKLHGMIAQYPGSLPKWKFCQYQQKALERQKLKFSCCVLFHMKTRVSLKYFVSYCLWKLFLILNRPRLLQTLFL